MDIAWPAIIAASILFTLGATSPGPSLIVVIRNTLLGGRMRGIACAIGHGLGFGIYCAVAVFGLVLMIESMPTLFVIMQFSAAMLLIWMANSLFRAQPEMETSENVKLKGFSEGFLIVFLNPKIAIFLLAVLSSLLEQGMNLETKISLGLLGLIIDMSWYLIIAIALSSDMMIERMQAQRQNLNRITGTVMLLMAGWVFLRLSGLF
ncbi:MAG: LysE family translocator [Candidatus Poseidoniales archaeon]|jgi:threonine/homoserine/homoserine lactone efflux protein